MNILKKLIIFVVLEILAVSVTAQTYSVDWHKVAGGGGTGLGTNGSTVYSISGTIGQHDASTTMVGGTFSVTSGFWSLVSLVQTPGAPNLSIALVGTNVIVSWANIGAYTLQQNPTLAVPANWVHSTYTVTTNANGTNSVTIASPSGQLFFRLGP